MESQDVLMVESEGEMFSRMDYSVPEAETSQKRPWDTSSNLSPPTTPKRIKLLNEDPMGGQHNTPEQNNHSPTYMETVESAAEDESMSDGSDGPSAKRFCSNSREDLVVAGPSRLTKAPKWNERRTIFPPLPRTSQHGIESFNIISCGAEFEGTICKRNEQTRKLTVKILNVDYVEGLVAGVMRIRSKVPNSPLIECFFEGEIIGFNNYTFETRKWCADSDIDEKFWGKFMSLEPAEGFPQKRCDYAELSRTGNTFMRWREKVPMTPDDVNSPGFTYVCLYHQFELIQGIYFDRLGGERDEEMFFVKYEKPRGASVFQIR